MARRSLKLDEFIADYPLWGEWEVSYTDGTHLAKNEYVKLGDITIDVSEQTARSYPILPFDFYPVTDKQIECDFSTIVKHNLSKVSNKEEKEKQANTIKAQTNQAKKTIRDQLADSIVRTGLSRPELCLMGEQTVEMRFLEVIRKVSKFGYLTLVVDTSALRRAAISFLYRTLAKVQIWTIIPVFVMTEVQRQINDLNTTWINSKNNPKYKNYKVLGQRPQVSTISRELNHIRHQRPVEILTTLPEHLGQSNGTSKIDRLIIESMKNIKRDRGLHQGVYLLTGDKDMASLASLENQSSLHIGVPPLLSEISSVRYDSYNGRLILTPIHYLLWDLAQVFSTIRFESNKLSKKYELVYYSQARGGFFAHDVMEIKEG